MTTVKRSSVIKRPLILTLALLSVPLIGTRISDEVHWTGFDFVVVGILLFAINTSALLLWRRLPQSKSIPWIIALVLLFLILWAEVAVGVFGSPIAGS